MCTNANLQESCTENVPRILKTLQDIFPCVISGIIGRCGNRELCMLAFRDDYKVLTVGKSADCIIPLKKIKIL